MLQSFCNSLHRLQRIVCQIHGFSSAMNLFIFCIYIPLVHSVSHTFMTTYTEINGLTIAGIPEFSAVTTLDEQQIDYYDSEIKKLVPRQDWMNEFASTETWKTYTEMRKRVEQINKINISILMEQFNHSNGVHTYQRMYGCDWDNETSDARGLDEHSYDGEDFITLDLKNSRYNTTVQQGLITTARWNNNKAQLDSLKEYYRNECADWLIYFLVLMKMDLNRRVSLLQKNSSSPVSCHATGFYPSAVTITWLRNGQEHYEDVDLGETLPNENGTFQKTVILNVPPEEWTKNQYVCVVKHMGNTIRKILTEDEIKSNRSKRKFEQLEGPKKTDFTILVLVIFVLIVILIMLVLVIGVCRKKSSGFIPLSPSDDGNGPSINKGL